mmetsp:Transcript_127579/g.367043  ORF Transcript_127579/g.367043 Transcript_127579/m.367043 type:complete len:320 (-) Transcript_127579:178-1137(-)
MAGSGDWEAPPEAVTRLVGISNNEGRGLAEDGTSCPEIGMGAAPKAKASRPGAVDTPAEASGTTSAETIALSACGVPPACDGKPCSAADFTGVSNATMSDPCDPSANPPSASTSTAARWPSGLSASISASALLDAMETPRIPKFARVAAGVAPVGANKFVKRSCKPTRRASSLCKNTVRLSGVTFTSTSCCDAVKDKMITGHILELYWWYVSLISFPIRLGGSIGRRFTKNSCMSRDRRPPLGVEITPEMCQPVSWSMNSNARVSATAASPRTDAADRSQPLEEPEVDSNVVRPAPCPRMRSATTWKRTSGRAIAYAWM